MNKDGGPGAMYLAVRDQRHTVFKQVLVRHGLERSHNSSCLASLSGRESRVERYDYSRLTGMTRLDRHVAAVPLNLSESRESSFLSASEVSDTPASATYPACHVSHDELVSRSRRSMSHSSLSRSESVNQGSVTFRRCWA